jgi:hypothetical protein
MKKHWSIMSCIIHEDFFVSHYELYYSWRLSVSRLLNHCIKPTQKTNDAQKTQNYCCITVQKSCGALNYCRALNLLKNYWCLTVQKTRGALNYWCCPRITSNYCCQQPRIITVELLPFLLSEDMKNIFYCLYL